MAAVSDRALTVLAAPEAPLAQYGVKHSRYRQAEVFHRSSKVDSQCLNHSSCVTGSIVHSEPKWPPDLLLRVSTLNLRWQIFQRILVHHLESTSPVTERAVARKGVVIGAAFLASSLPSHG